MSEGKEDRFVEEIRHGQDQLHQEHNNSIESISGQFPFVETLQTRQQGSPVRQLEKFVENLDEAVEFLLSFQSNARQNFFNAFRNVVRLFFYILEKEVS